MTDEEKAAVYARLDEQDRRIAMLENYDLDHHENIRRALDAIKANVASVEFLMNERTKTREP